MDEIEAGVVGQLFGLPMGAIGGRVACILGVGAIVKIWPQLVRLNGDEPVLAGDTAFLDHPLNC